MKIRLRRDKLAGGLGLLLALGLIVALAVPALAVPQMPHQFFGTVTVGTALAPEGTIVSARIGGTEYLSGSVDADSRYGYDPLFKVPADGPATPEKEGGVPGETVEFYITNEALGVNEVKANETAEFVIWGVTPLNLTVAGVVTHTLTVTSDGCCTITVGELGTVAAGATQAFEVAAGIDVELEAVVPDCCSFDAWEVDGSAVEGNPITVTMDGDHTAIATCSELGPFTLTVVADPAEGGTVTGGGDYDCGDEPAVEAIPEAGWEFTGWSGDLTGDTNPTTILMDGDKTVTANFAHEEETYDLTTNSTAGGEVTNPGEATFTYDAGIVVNLVATPDADYVFLNWTGDVGTVANVNAATTTITMNGNYEITANFALEEETFDLTTNSTAGGEVTDPGEATFTYDAGTVVDLVATPYADYEFLFWSGDVSTVADVNAATTTITMNGNYEITANFGVWILELGEEWNIISTPITLDPSSNTWGEFVALGDGLDYEIAWYYDGNIFKIAGASYPFVPCDALYVYMNSADTAPIIPSSLITPPPHKDLVGGWGLIGSAFLNETGELPLNEALISLYYAEGEFLPWGYSQVISPAYNQPSWMHTRDGTLYNMVVGKGYWVSMENADRYDGQTYTPWP